MTEHDITIETARWETAVMLRALDTYGPWEQMVQTMEECAELSAALSHMRRFRSAKARQDMIGELADVSIMIEQMKLAFDCRREVDIKIVEKLARLDRRLEDKAHHEQE